MCPSKDSIAAIASGLAPGAIGVVRVSGPAATRVLEQVTGLTAPLARHAHKLVFRGLDGCVIDDGLALFFPGPHSFTGEDVLELQGHGGPAVLQMVLDVVVRLSTPQWPIRLARPGEFSERAFHAGKLDLLQAQGIADLIAASSTQAARAAMQSLRGGFSQAVEGLQRSLTELRVRVEACLDFPEEDIELVTREQLGRRMAELSSQFEGVFAAAQRGAALSQGLTIGLIGAPNVGKSSLLNALAEDDLAIVTPVAGTTRDRIVSQIMLDGIPVSLVDTAGIRDAQDEVEQLGIARSWQMLEQADLLVWVIDATGEHVLSAEHLKALAAHLSQRRDLTGTATPLLLVYNQMDRVLGEPAGAEVRQWEALVSAQSVRVERLALSAKTGQGLDLLRSRIKSQAGWTTESGETAYSARGRQLDALARAQEGLNLGAHWLEQGALELFAEQLRLAQGALSELTGTVHSDDLLGEIFSSFCIGK
jgi:tRNA modification GTPase